MLLRSPRGAFSSTWAVASFSLGTLSPVRADSSLFRLTLFSSRASAGMKSPASRRMMSPGTSWAASMTCSFPSRSTLAWGADMFFRASMAFSALDSCIMPSRAFNTTMSKISTGSKNSMGSWPKQATTKLTAAASSRMSIITSLNWSKNRWRFVFFLFSASLFSPYRSRRCRASWLERPAAEVCSSFRSSSWEVL